MNDWCGELRGILGDEAGGAVCRHLDDPDAVVESDTCNHHQQLICALSSRQVFDAAMTSLNTISLAVVDDSDRPHVREHALDGIGRAQVIPMLGGKN